jgi:hypothetical protein
VSIKQDRKVATPSLGGVARLQRRTTKRVAALIAMSGALVGVGMSSAPAGAQTSHTSHISTPYCVSVPYVPDDCTGFIIGAGSTVQMTCWNTGPTALGQSKWFEITDLNSGRGSGVSGEVPAPAVAVSSQWLSAPRCST